MNLYKEGSLYGNVQLHEYSWEHALIIDISISGFPVEQTGQRDVQAKHH